MELLPGDRLGRYRVVRRLAAGGMAEVYLAKSLGHAGFVKPIALKRILPNHASEPDYRDMFLREAAFAARLNHTNIVHVFDFAKERDELYLAMEYVHGINLQKLRADSIQRFAETGDPAFRIHPMLAAHICRCVCRALHHAWNVLDENGQPLHLIHRDVSPQNILLSYEGDTKLTDFGIAKPAELTTSMAAIKGKLRYMSPEQAKGKNLNASTDIFSVGVVLYETALGLARPLFHGDSRESILAAVDNRPIDPPEVVSSDFPPMLSQVIVKALKRDPQKRFQTAMELSDALEESIQQESNSAQDYNLASFIRRLYGEPSRIKGFNSTPLPTSNNLAEKTEMIDETIALPPDSVEEISTDSLLTSNSKPDPAAAVSPPPAPRVYFRWYWLVPLIMAIGLIFFVKYPFTDSGSNPIEKELESKIDQRKQRVPQKGDVSAPTSKNKKESVPNENDKNQVSPVLLIENHKEKLLPKPSNKPGRHKKPKRHNKPKGNGTLVVRFPSWGFVWVNKERPKYTKDQEAAPVLRRSLPAGNHVIHLRSAEGLRRDKKVKIRAGKDKILDF